MIWSTSEASKYSGFDTREFFGSTQWGNLSMSGMFGSTVFVLAKVAAPSGMYVSAMVDHTSTLAVGVMKPHFSSMAAYRL